MATNPMQRQARNSFLLGMVLTLVISVAIVALLFMRIKKLNEELKLEQTSTANVYVLARDIKSGQVLTKDMFVMKEVKMAGIPGDATSDITSLINNYTLCDKEGRDIYTDADGSLYMQSGETKTPVYKEATTGKYYIQATNGTKTYIETAQKELVAKVDIKANTVLSASFIARADQLATDDVRIQEYNMIVLPTDLITGDYVDFRLMFPNGQDFIIASKKMVTIPEVGGEYLSDTIQVNMAEEEILSMSNAIVEAYKVSGSKLYVTKYKEAGIQEASKPTYVVNEEVANLIDSNPNIVAEAMTALSERYNANGGKLKNIRNQYINSTISNNGEDEKVGDSMEESITSTQESRKQYLQSLTGSGTVGAE